MLFSSRDMSYLRMSLLPTGPSSRPKYCSLPPNAFHSLLASSINLLPLFKIDEKYVLNVPASTCPPETLSAKACILSVSLIAFVICGNNITLPFSSVVCTASKFGTADAAILDTFSSLARLPSNALTSIFPITLSPLLNILATSFKLSL